MERLLESSEGPLLFRSSTQETSGSARENRLAPPAGPARWGLSTPPGTRTQNRCPPPLDIPKQAHSSALPRRLFSSTRTRRGVPGCSRAHSAPNRSWAAGSAPLVRQMQGGEPERSRGPAVLGGRGRRDCQPVTYARALGNPMESSTSSADPCLMVPGRCWRFLRGVTLLYSSSLAAMPSGLGLPY